MTHFDSATAVVVMRVSARIVFSISRSDISRLLFFSHAAFHAGCRCSWAWAWDAYYCVLDLAHVADRVGRLL